MIQEKNNFIDTIKVAGGRTIPDLLIKNGKIIDVFNGAIIEETVAVHKGIIVGISTLQRKRGNRCERKIHFTLSHRSTCSH